MYTVTDNSAILSNDAAKWFGHIRTSKENGVANEAIVLEGWFLVPIRLQSCEKAMESCTAQCKMLLFNAKM